MRLEAKKSGNGLIRVYSRFDHLWDGFIGWSDFYCSSIIDLENNLGEIRDGRIVSLKRAMYESSNETQLITDCTGEIGVKPGFMQEEKLRALTDGSFIYDIALAKKKGDIYIKDFNLRGPIRLEGNSDKEYLQFRFPGMIPIQS